MRQTIDEQRPSRETADTDVGPTAERTVKVRRQGSRRLVAGRASVLPSARAALGALLCLIGGLLSFSVVSRSNRPPTTTFAVANRDLAPGDVLHPGDVTSVRIDLPPGLRSSAVEGDPADLDGVTVLGPVARGELLQRGSLVRRATPAATFSFPVSAELANAGRLRSGDRITLFATDGSSATPATQIASDVLVVRVDGDTAARGTLIVTVALDPSIERARLVSAAASTRLAIVVDGSRTPPANAAATATQAPTQGTAAITQARP